MAGGQGSRLRPLTLTRPKPMVEVLGRPVIDFVKDAMVDAGVDYLVVTTGYRGEQLSAHVAQWSHHSGMKARINQEKPIITTCGSGVTAAIISLALEIVGYKNHSVYDGSWTEWGQFDQLPVEVG